MLVQDGSSCLWVACFGGHREIVKYLYGCGGEALLMLTMEVSWQELLQAALHVCDSQGVCRNMLSKLHASETVDER